MSVNKEQIIQYILSLIAANDRNFVSKTVEYFGISKSTVYNYLGEMCKNNMVFKAPEDGSYRLVYDGFAFNYKNIKLDESRIFDKDILPLLSECAPNVRNIWKYAFTEMMNNAIEHSNAENIAVFVDRSKLNVVIHIDDDGMGIFRNIQRFMIEERKEDLELEECVSLLFAGKFTTAKERHSGEGIFFTSHMMDEFSIVSDKMCFTRNVFRDSSKPEQNFASGTLVRMSIHNQSKKNALEVFNRFSDIEEGFVKTHVPIAHIFPSCYPVSRSEARRLSELISKFKEITLDFTNVEEVGQAFCHELFVVWHRNNPDVIFNIVNANENVDFMIRRVKNTK